jgi:hypothetical protein
MPITRLSESPEAFQQACHYVERLETTIMIGFWCISDILVTETTILASWKSGHRGSCLAADTGSTTTISNWQ